mgnify:CR=1 FL=1
MAKKKKGRSRTTTANRMDYRTGGRVGYRPGGRVPGEPGKPLPRAVRPSERGRQTPSAPTTTRPNTAPASVQTNNDFYDSEIGMSDEEIRKIAEEAAKAATRNVNTQPSAQDYAAAGQAAVATSTTSEKTPEQIEREQKAQETLMQSVEGKVPDAAKIPDLSLIHISEPTRPY